MADLDRHALAEYPNPIQIEIMRKKHLDQVMAIERRAYVNPWSRGVFESELQQGTSRLYVMARSGRAVLGYCGSLYIIDEAHITNIAVDPTYRRSHIGTRLMLHTLRRALERNIVNVTLEVRVSNHGAQRMYQKFGFQPAGIRKGYYQENGEDALIMWAYDIDTPEYQERLKNVEVTSGILDQDKRRKRRIWL